jgi:excisionase family DNA binding protein
MSALPTEPLDPDRLLSPDEAAALLQISGKTLRQWAREAKIPAIKLGPRHWRFRRSALLEWAAEQERPARSGRRR